MHQPTSNSELHELQHQHNLLDSELHGSTGEKIIQARLLVVLSKRCAEIASRHCLKETPGVRCFRCRPFILTLLQPNGMRRHVTFQQDPACAQ